MKLKFDKKEDGEVAVQVDNRNFVTKDYIKMVKEIKDKKDIEVEFGENVSTEEQESINSMIKDINNIKQRKVAENEQSETSSVDDIPF